MYVFYPADELLRIYENPIRDPVSLTVNDAAATVNAGRETTAAGYEQQQQQQQQLNRRQHQQQQRIAVVAADYANVADDVSKRKKERRRDNAGQTNTAGGRQFSTVRNDNGNGDLGKKGRREEQHATGTMQNNRAAGEEAANPLRDLTQPSLNEQLKQLNGNTLKIVQTIAEFAKELGLAMDSHSANVQCLVDDFRKRSGDSRTGDSRTGDSRTGDSRTDISGIQRVWESLLRQVEKDAASHRDVAQLLQQQSTIIDACFYRKVQSRKVFTHRDAYEQMIGKTEEKLQRARLDYKRAYAALLANDDGGAEQELKRAYLESHNAYILQLRATNATTERYQFHCLPGLLGEIGEAYEDVCGLACKFVAGISNAVVERAFVQAKRYQTVMKDAQTVVPMNDLQTIARNMSASTTPRKPPRRLFVAPAPPEQIPMERINQISTLRDELVLPGTSTLSLIEDLRLDYESLTQDIDRLQDALDSLVRIQRKSFEISLYTKMQEMQEEISLKRFDLGVAQLRLAAVQAQKELFGGGEAGQPDGMASRKMSNGSTGSPKLKWLKAFKSLKTSSPTTPPPSEKPKNLDSEGGHVWRAYTYRKITPCDACGLVLRGHSLQGCRCRNCKANAHMDCIGVVQPALCPSLAPKKSGGIPLLRRQKTQVADEVPPATQSAEHNVDAIYQVLKQAGEIRGNSTNSPPTPPTAEHPPSGAAPSSTRTSSHPCSSSTSAPHSPQRHREKLNLRMKSLSLDSPNDTVQRPRPRDYPAGQRETTPPPYPDSGSINRLSPCSPGTHKHPRRTIRMSSMELPDENEKSYSSASTSPCPSPHATNPPGKRVLPPNNLYVVLYNFEARHQDELDLKAGYKVTVIDKSEKDWWKGKCLGGRAGYFPSAYVMRVESGQRTLQVTRNLQLADQTTLLRDQIVIQVGEEVDGVAMVRCAADMRSADHIGKEGDVLYKETLCPLKYLQEV